MFLMHRIDFYELLLLWVGIVVLKENKKIKINFFKEMMS
ncbi:hypothetical protein LEP1GSC083_1256 [Leptospira interrogans serovar Pyrogenes str. L0374]|uniref:Uncharacterized protein n=1 Tax=Leptospira interrogans serovar Pyrogenes str. L0374 TaxID=1049928 RepID=M6KJL2_LEPIR|nr:hypothetical protein LEP1GSC083_1256 [Leptospira interrogans serovar Pyrogenes str. L0374]